MGSNTPGCGCGPMMCGGNLDRDPAELSPMEQEELELLKTTCWCFFAYCFGFGCNSPGGSDACCKVEEKLCCLWANLETDTCCDDGRIENTSKVCCCVADASYPAGRTPGVVCCNQTLCMQQRQMVPKTRRGCQRKVAHRQPHLLLLAFLG